MHGVKGFVIDRASDAKIRRMLTRVTRRMRRWAATGLVAVYAMCVAGPVAAFAFADGSTLPPCITEANHGLGATHVHDDGAAHSHDGAAPKHSHHTDDQQGTAGKCCGLLCFPAVTPIFQSSEALPARVSMLPLSVERGIPSRAPDRLYRPPITLLSL
jgi:hypothetical protein